MMAQQVDRQPSAQHRVAAAPQTSDELWAVLCQEAEGLIAQEPSLSSLMRSAVLEHTSFSAALTHAIASKLAHTSMPFKLLQQAGQQACLEDAGICEAAVQDILAVYNRDPACENYLPPLLFFKGYHALQSYRIANWLWHQGRTTLALYIQNQSSVRFDVDIHPATRIGHGIMLDHASGIVVGETAVIEDNVSMLQGVTLGGTGKETGDRHPKIRHGVLIGAGASILGNIEVGEGAKIGAGSVVLQDVPPHSTAAGVPAKIIGKADSPAPALTMDHGLEPKAD